MFERGGIGQPQILVESGSVMTIRNLLIDSDCLTLLSPIRCRWSWRRSG
jgi:hypothetical protein